MSYADLGITPRTKVLATDSLTVDVLTDRTIAAFTDVASGSILHKASGLSLKSSRGEPGQTCIRLVDAKHGERTLSEHREAQARAVAGRSRLRLDRLRSAARADADRDVVRPVAAGHRQQARLRLRRQQHRVVNRVKDTRCTLHQIPQLVAQPDGRGSDEAPLRRAEMLRRQARAQRPAQQALRLPAAERRIRDRLVVSLTALELAAMTGDGPVITPKGRSVLPKQSNVIVALSPAMAMALNSGLRYGNFSP